MITMMMIIMDAHHDTQQFRMCNVTTNVDILFSFLGLRFTMKIYFTTQSMDIKENKYRASFSVSTIMILIHCMTYTTRSSATAEKQRVSCPHGGG